MRILKRVLNHEMRELLKKIKNSNFISYECECVYGMTYGNLRINTDKYSIEITNFEETADLFGEEEDVTGFKCAKVDGSEDFKPYCIGMSKEYDINKKITGIKIINDFIVIDNEDMAMSYDQAIIFEMGDSSIMFSREAWFSENIDISEDDDYNSVYSVKSVEEVWQNGDPDRKVSVKRSVTIL